MTPDSALTAHAPGRAQKLLGFTATLLAALAIFFHGQIENGFTVLTSDRFDGVIETAILEHWWNVLRGLEPWSATAYFYPAPDTLGYNDGYFLYGLIYAAPRALGIDPYLSSEIVNIVLRAIGFAGFYALLRHGVLDRSGASPFAAFAVSLLGALLFTISAGAAHQANHQQLLAVGFIPIAGLLLIRLLRHMAAGQRLGVLACGCGFAVFLSAWLLTAYYMAFFFTLFLCLTAATWAVGSRRAGRAAFLAQARAVRGPLLGVAAVQLVTLIPFLTVYLPKLRETGGQGLRDTMYYLAAPSDLFQLGRDNLVWGGVSTWLMHWLQPHAPEYSEHTVGFPYLMLAGFLLACLWLIRTRRDPALRVPRLLALVAVLTWLCVTHSHGVFPWKVIYTIMPGARGARVVVRIQIALVVPMLAVLMTLLARWHDSLRHAPGRLLLVPLGAALVLEQVNIDQPMVMDRAGELAVIRSVPPPPAGCPAFYVARARAGSNGSAEDNAIYSHNVDAMMIAELVHLPTINGFSTFNPPGWNFADPERPDYRDRVAAYARANAIPALCALDLRAFTWRLDRFAPG